MQRRIRRAFTSIKEHTCVSYAKIATIGGFCDIDHIIVKATAPDDFPLPDKYVHDLLKIFSLSPSSYPAFALGFAHRFRRTRSWRVALKCLLLLHRLLRATPNDSPFRADLLWARTNNVLSLYPCYFQDSSSSTPDEYTNFVRSYARLLDEALDCVSFELVQPQLTPDNADYSIFEPLDNEEEKISTPLKIKDLEGEIEILPQLQSLIDRAVDCWPAGAASRSFLVHAAMKHVIRDSFACYAVFRGEITAILDNLIQLPYRSCVAAFAIYKKAAVQADQLSGFHQWCKSMGYCGSYEYPIIDRVPDIQIRALESFLDGMWQLTDQSSSNVSTETSDKQSPSSTTDNDGEKQAKEEMKFDKVVKKEMEVEMGPLIEWEVESWEDLLEASIGTDSLMASRSKEEEYGLQMQVYSPCVLQTQNPFLPAAI